MKTDVVKHGKLKQLFFPERGEVNDHEGKLPARVARFTSVSWVAHILMSESNKHRKGVNSALRHGTEMSAPFVWSQAEKDALKEAKDKKLKDAGAKYLLDTKDEREAKKAAQEAAARRKRIECAEV